MDKVKMGKFLTQLRNERNLRQQDEADIFQVSPQAISKWESGESVPDIGTLEKLSEFYKVGIDEIINGEVKNPNAGVSTLVVAKNPTMEDKGIGKPFYGAFIFCMSALLLALFLAILPLMNITTSYSSGYYTNFFLNFYQTLFQVQGWPAILVWLSALTFLPSSLLSIGLWLDKNHRRIYWNWCFWLNLSSLVISVITVVTLSAANLNGSGITVSVGPFVFVIFHIVYFVLFLTLPITKKSTYCPPQAASLPSAK